MSIANIPSKDTQLDKILEDLKALRVTPKPADALVITNAQLNEIASILGSGYIKSVQELIDILKARTSILIDMDIAPITVELEPEDLSALKDQFHGTGYSNFEAYAHDTISNAIAQFVSGSTRNFEIR